MRTFLCLALCLFLSCISFSQTITPVGPVGICPGDHQDLSVTGITPTAYQWMLNGSSVSANPIYSATVAGTYTVIINGGGPGDTLGPVIVTLNPKPVADFTYAPNSGCPRRKRKIFFTSTSTIAGGTALTYDWNFGDPNSGGNNTSTSQNPTHSFVGVPGGAAQSFTVQLIVTSNNGCKDTVTHTVSFGQFPDASLYDADNSPQFTHCGAGNFDLNVVNNSATIATNTNYQIFWGDGNSYVNTTMGTLSHTYTTQGYFTLTFVVSGPGNCNDTTDYVVFNGTNPGVGIYSNGATIFQCLPAVDTFFITGVSGNSPGTTYTVSFNDGSPSLVFTSPPAPPAFFTHTFTTSSCGATPQGVTPNTFYVRIRAENPCGFLDGSVEPITTITKPTANFSISPDTVICTNTTATFTNTSVNGVVVQNNGVCDNSSITNWIIAAITGSPVGWTVTSGYIGLPNPAPGNTATWGTTSLGVNFTLPGTYSVTLIVRNFINQGPNCRIDSITKTVCIQSPPVPSFTATPLSGCNPLVVNFTNTSTGLPICGTVTRVWTVTKTGFTCLPDSVNDYSFISGTNAASQNPVIQFNNQGTYSVTLSLIGACGTIVSVPVVITVKSKPQFSITSSATICVGQSTSPTANPLDCGGSITSTNWSFPGGSPASSNQADPGPINFTIPGNHIISLSVTNECGTTNETTPIAVNTTPIPIVPLNIIRCAGTTIGPLNFTSVTPGASFSWTNSNPSIGLAASGTSNPIPVFTATNATGSPITATISVTASLNDCSSSVTFTITVNPLPPAPVATSPVNYCQNATATPLTATAAAGNTLLWYSTATGGVGSATAPTPVTTATGSFSFYVSQATTATGCEGPRTLITVNVNASPAIAGNTHINPNTCGTSTGSISLTGLTAGISYTVSYTQNGNPQSVTIVANAGGTVIIPNLAAGIYDAITVTSLGCSSTAVGPVTLSDPSTPATPTTGSNSPICAGNTLTLTSSTTSPGTVTYHWTGPGGFNDNSQNTSIPNAPATASGTYFVTATINGCNSLPGSVAVVVNPTPALPTVSSNSPVCVGNTLNLTANTTFPGPATYSWTGPNGFNSNQLNTSITNVTAAATGTYSFTITATTGACASPQATTAVVINPTPHISGGTSLNPASCSSSTGSITLTGLIPSQTYTVTYTYNSAAQTGTFTSTATGILIVTGLAAGTYDNIIATLNGCPSNPVGPFTLTDPTPPATPVINNSGPVCSGGSLTLTSTAAPAGATYNWTGPGGYISNVQNPVITPAQLSDAGVYSLSIILNACTSASVSTTVVINETPAVPTVNNNGPVCTGNTLNLSASTTFAGQVNYSWSGPNSFSSNQQNPSITNITAAAGGTYTVTATSQASNCVSVQANTIVVVNTTPAISSDSFINPSSCASATGSITLNGLIAGATYTVNYLEDGVGNTASITANGSGQVIITNLTSGVYSGITVTLLGCQSNVAGPFTLVDPNPPAPPVAGSNSSICLGATLNLTALSGATGTITYSWTGPDGFTSAQQNPIIPNTTALAAGMYYVNVQVNNCTSLNDSVLVVINPLGALPIAPSPVSYCIDNTAVSLTATANPGNTLNWYDIATGGTPLASAPVPATTVAGSTFYYVSQTTALGCEGPRTPIEVIIHPDAKAFFDPTDTIGCPQFQLTPAIVNLQLFPANNSDYEWYANGVLIGTGVIFPGYTIVNENDVVTIKLKAISLFGCKNDSISHNFHTYNLPHPVFTMSDSVGCGPLSVLFQNTTPNITQFNYLWDFGNGITSNLEQPGTIIFQSNPTFNDTVYVIKLKVFSICDTLIYSDSVRVKSKPRALYTPSITTGCSPMSVLFTNTSGGNNNTYYWNFDDGNSYTTTSADTFTHVFHTGVVDTFYVQLVAVNECGSDSITYAIIAAPNNIHLNFSFNGTDAYGCAPHAVAFINNTIGAGSFEWNFGDGNTQTTIDNIDTVYHTYLSFGTFAVSVHAQNNCTDTTAIKYITVFPKPVAAFIASQYNVCIGQSVQFTNQSDSANAYGWQFGDGITSTLANPSHAYASPGLYTVTLTSYHNNPDGSSCIDSIQHEIQVTSTLPGNISLSATTGVCVPFTITFINHDIPSVTAVWDFGDGNGATGDSVVHTYLTPGTFTVTATVTSPGGCTFNSSQVVTISGPIGSLMYTGGFVCYPDPVRFEVTGSGATNLLWDFGDGNTLLSNQLVVYHNYTNPGIYIPSVTLQSASCNFSIQGLDTIKVDKIDAGFSLTEQQYCGYSNIIFTDTSHIFFGESLVEWDFGDGNFASGPSVTHQYTASGIYNITMVVTGNSGCTDTVYKQLDLHINNIPVVSIIADAVRCANETVDFVSNIASADPVNITHWTLSNGVSGNGTTFSYLFNIPGTYSLQLIVGTTNGCFDTTNHTITINPVPVVTSTNDLTICLGNSAPLLATGPSPLQWTPIQGLSCTNCPNPIATPLITTPYIVSGANSFGCFGYDTTVITVIQPLHLSVSPDDSICIGQSTNLLVSGGSSYQWSPATGLNSTVIPNPTANPTVTIRYRVVGYDGYNCFTDTAYVLVAIGQYPTVDLGPDLTLATGTMQPLTSVITNGPIAQWLWEPATNLSCADCNIPVAEVKTEITYKVTVTTEYGCQATDAINIKVFCLDAQVFIPNAFTPNGDGKNDILMVRGKGIVTVRYFRIFNRWGEVVFERNNFPPNNPAYGWDGRINGKFCPPGVFVYTAGVICENGTPYEYKGNTTIIK